MEAVHLLTFKEVRQAQPVKERLAQAGITAKIQDEQKIQRFFYMSPALASVHIFVDHPQVERAQALLREWHHRDGALRDALHCPQCGSWRVQFPQVTRKIASAWVYALACAIGLMKREFYCKDCHFTWPVKPGVEMPRDILDWPKKRGQESSG